MLVVAGGLGGGGSDGGQAAWVHHLFPLLAQASTAASTSSTSFDIAQAVRRDYVWSDAVCMAVARQ